MSGSSNGARRLVLGGLVVLALSCQLVLGLDHPKPDPDAIDAGAPAASDPCRHAALPLPPSSDGEAPESKSYWLAGERVIVPLFPDAGVKEGLDLDDSCTCERDRRDGGPSCTIQGSSTVCDYDSGIDDSLTALSARFPVGDLFDPGDAVNRYVRDGVQTLLFYVERYNGQANDSDVGVAILNAGGLFSDLGCDDRPRGRTSRGRGLDPNEPGDHWEPAWDGCDQWTPEVGRTIGEYPRVQPFGTSAGYVRDGVLVTSADTIGLTILGSSSRVRSGRLVARLTKVGESLSMAGYVTGRLPFSQLVDLVGRTDHDEEGTRKPLCSSKIWPALAELLCGARDIMEDSSKDNTGAACDAASVAVGFSASPARVASGTYTPPPRVIDCNASVVCP